LPGAKTKNNKMADIPLRQDLTTDLKQWIEATGKKGADRFFWVPVPRH
jgi:hypothetical protein